MNNKRRGAKLGAFVLVVIALLVAVTLLLPNAYADEVSGSGPSVAALATNPSPTPRANPANAMASSLYLPLVLRSFAGNPGATPPPPGGSTGAFFLPWVINGEAQATDGPSIAVDGNGGVHVAYAAYTSDASGKRPAYYVYCASNCNSPSSFGTPVALGDKVDHVNLKLDSSGRPRILWVGIDLTGQKLDGYYYATCNSGCTSSTSWSATRVLGTDSGLPHNSRIFSLDPQGRPRFVFYEDWCNGNCPVNKGTFLIYCDSGCTSPTSWLKRQISTEELGFVSLAITTSGQPRMAGTYLDLSTTPALRYAVYLECDTYCVTVTQGAAYPIFACSLCNEPGGYLNLTLDSANRPRLALYTGALEAGRGMDANRLYYLWCNTSCGDLNASDWTGYSLGLPVGVGAYVDVALGPQSRPRLAYEDVSRGLVYAWCTAGCESTSPSWQTTLADSSATLDVTEPVPPIPPCAVAGWFTGKRSSLAFDSSGNPRIAFDAEHWQGLDPVTNPPGSPGCSGFRQDQINARVAVFGQP